MTVEERLDELEGAIEDLQERREIYRDTVLGPRLDDIQAESDDARAERAELRAQIQDLQQELRQVHAKLDSIAGLTENQETSPEKRIADLRQCLIRRAESRSDGFDGSAAMWWKEVRDLFADLNHGEVSKPVCFDAIHDAADYVGFSETTKLNENGNEVLAVKVELDALSAENRSSDPTTSEPPSDPQNGGESGENAIAD